MHRAGYCHRHTVVVLMRHSMDKRMVGYMAIRFARIAPLSEIDLFGKSEIPKKVSTCRVGLVSCFVFATRSTRYGPMPVTVLDAELAFAFLL